MLVVGATITRDSARFMVHGSWFMGGVAAIVGVYWGDCVQYEPVRAREQMSALTAAVADGKVAPIVSGRHPLERLQEALARVSARAVIGKRIVLI